MRQILKIGHSLNAPQELIVVRLLVTMGWAAMVATTSLYLKSLGMTDSAIGIATAAVMGINLIFALTLPLFLRKYDLIKIIFTTTLGFGATLVTFGSINKAYIALLFYVIARLLLSLFSSAYSILFHDDSPSTTTYRRNQALAGSINNFAWMIMPFFATLVVVQFSFTTLYLMVAVLTLIACAILTLEKVPEKKKTYTGGQISIIKNIKYYFSQKRLRDVYFISAGVDMWWVFIFTFVTLFMKDAGYSTSSIGIYLTITQLPLFLFEFKTYALVNKYRYKAPFINSYTFMAFALFITFIFGINAFTLALMAFCSLFVVFLEPAREIYLYDKLSPSDEERVQPVYATAELTGSIMIRFCIGLLLVWFSPSLTFGFMALIMGAIAWNNRSIKD